MFIETQTGDIINTDRIQKITIQEVNEKKWILTAVLNETYSHIGIFNNLYELVKYKQRLKSIIKVIDLDEDEEEQD